MCLCSCSHIYSATVLSDSASPPLKNHTRCVHPTFLFCALCTMSVCVLAAVYTAPFSCLTLPHHLLWITQVACILLPMCFFYDIFWVFLSPYFFGGNSVMVEVRNALWWWFEQRVICIMLYYAVLCCTILYYTVLYYGGLSSAFYVLYCTILYYTMVVWAARYMYYAVLCCTILWWRWATHYGGREQRVVLILWCSTCAFKIVAQKRSAPVWLWHFYIIVFMSVAFGKQHSHAHHRAFADVQCKQKATPLCTSPSVRQCCVHVQINACLDTTKYTPMICVYWTQRLFAPRECTPMLCAFGKQQ